MNKLLQFSCILCLLGLQVLGEAQAEKTTEIQEKTFSSKEVQSLLIRTIYVNLKVKKNSSSVYKIKWAGEDLSFEINKGQLRVESNNFHSQKAWDQAPPQKLPLLEISGPSIPLELFALSSESSISHWTQPVFISSFKGEIKGSKNKGPWQISLKEGRIFIDKQEGSLSVRGFRVHNLITSSEGDFKFYINEGKIRIKQSEGLTHWTTNKANLHLSKFKGSLQGFSQSGAITASLEPQKVDIEGRSGAIRLYVMGKAPRVKAYTERGKIYSPKYFHKQFSGKSTEVSGRMRSFASVPSKEGTISLKSDTGNIYIN